MNAPNSPSPNPVTRTTMLNADYHRAKHYLSSSAISMYLKSPPLFGMWLRGEYEREPGEAMLIGTGVDALLSGTFGDEVIVAPEVDRRTKVGKAMWEEFQEQAGGKTVLSVSQFEKCQGMASAVMEHKEAASLLQSADNQQACYFWEDATGKWKIRPDAENFEGVIELKTHRPFECEEDAAEEWAAHAWNYGYYRQAALYRRGVALHRGVSERELRHLTIAVCNESPYTVHLFEYDPELLNYGWGVCHRVSLEIRDRLEMNFWGVSGKLQKVGAPRWARRKVRMQGN